MAESAAAAREGGKDRRLDLITIGRCSVDLYGQQIGGRDEEVGEQEGLAPPLALDTDDEHRHDPEHRDGEGRDGEGAPPRAASLGLGPGEAVERVGPDRVLYGSDAPFHHPSVELTKVRVSGLSSELVDRVLGENGRELFFGGRQPDVVV